MRVLFAAVEMAPLAKVGGLADVIGSLPAALVAAGHDVRVILPLHAGIDTAGNGFRQLIPEFAVPTPRGPERAEVWQGAVGGVVTYLVQSEDMYERPAIYGEPDDAQRWLFFSDALLEAVPRLDWLPEVLHLHDWHAAFVAARLHDAPDHPLAGVPTVYTIHNLPLRGDLDDAFFAANGLNAPRMAGTDPAALRSGMVLGVAWSDVISTVSETYAREILRPEFGAGLDPLLRERQADLFGIVNGIDEREFDPATDAHIAAPFSVDAPEGKAANKAALQRLSGLTEDATLPVIGMVGRLFDQKGADIAIAAIESLLSERPVQFVVIGSGEAAYEEQLRELERRRPAEVRFFPGFDLTTGRRIYAGADLFLMPSRYEPCGLGQLIAMRYGTVPVVHATGGLVDTVRDDDAHRNDGNGFVFVPAEPSTALEGLRRALAAYTDPVRWQGIVRRAMARDSSWGEAAPKYLALYDAALSRRQARDREAGMIADTPAAASEEQPGGAPR